MCGSATILKKPSDESRDSPRQSVPPSLFFEISQRIHKKPPNSGAFFFRLCSGRLLSIFPCNADFYAGPLRSAELSVAFGGRGRRSSAGRRLLLFRLLLPCFLDERLARKPDLVALNRQHLHQNLVAQFQFITNVANAMLGNFTDVQQAVGAREKFHEGAEF